MKHFATQRFWRFYVALPEAVQTLADKSFELLKTDRQHPSVHFKKVGRFWSARVGRGCRVLAVQEGDDFIWFWIGNHDEYDRLLG